MNIGGNVTLQHPSPLILGSEGHEYLTVAPCDKNAITDNNIIVNIIEGFININDIQRSIR